MLESSLHFPIHFLPLPLIPPFTFPLPLALYTRGKLQSYHTILHIIHTSIFQLSSFSIFDLDYHFPFIHSCSLFISIRYPTYFHNPFIYLILTFYPYLASHSPCHVHFIHFLSMLLYTSIPLSYVLGLGYPFHFLYFISPISSISFILLSLFHTLPPISLIHSPFRPMLMINTRFTTIECSCML